MQKHKEVLLVIPTLGKRLDLLEKTLESVKLQKQGLIDLVVVCPKNAKEARKLASSYGATLLDDPGTLSGALNSGFAISEKHHKYGAWMGDDDLLEPNTTEGTARLLDNNPSAVVAFGHCNYINDIDEIIMTNKAGKSAPLILGWGPNLVPLIGMLYRMSALKKAGEFDTNLKYAMDLDMLLRLKKQGKFINTRRVIGSFRWHSSSTTVANRNASLNEAEQIKRKYFPAYISVFKFLWEKPVRIATSIAAKRVSARSNNI